MIPNVSYDFSAFAGSELFLEPACCPILVEFSLLWLGVKFCHAAHYREPSGPQEQIGFSFVLKGEGEVRCGGGWERFAAGDAMLFPMTKARAFRCGNGHGWYYGSAVWDPSGVVGQEIAQVAPGRISLAAETMFLLAWLPIGDWLEFHDGQTLRGHLTTFLNYVLRALKPGSGARTFEMVWNQVGAHLANPWDVEALARRAGMSESAFRRACLAKFKASPMKHLTMLRLERAAYLLGTHSARVGDVAESVGYTDAFAFSRAFHRHFGVAPKQYQKRQEESPDQVA